MKNEITRLKDKIEILEKENKYLRSLLRNICMMFWK